MVDVSIILLESTLKERLNQRIIVALTIHLRCELHMLTSLWPDSTEQDR